MTNQVRERVRIALATLALVLLLAVVGPRLWRAMISGNQPGPTESLATATAGSQENDPPSVDGPSAARPSTTTQPSAPSPAPSKTHSVAVLNVSITPELFDEPSSNAGGRAPFDEENRAEEFALGVVEEVVERGKAKYLPLKLTKVFVGRLPTGTFLAEDKMVVRIECSLPQIDLGTRSQLYKAGSKVVVYLSRDEAKRWQVTSIVPIAPGTEEYWHKRLQPFADVMRAAEAGDPEKIFREPRYSPAK